MRRSFLAAIGASALAVSLLGAVPAHAALEPRDAPPVPTLDRVFPGPGPGQITVDWNASAGATKYSVEYTPVDPAGEPVEVLNLPGSPTAYTISGLDADTSYIVAVAAGNGDGYSAYSVPSNSLKPLPVNPPIDPKATAQDGGILVSWTAPTPSPTVGYEVQLKATQFPELNWSTSTFVNNGTSVLFTEDLSPALTYIFQVRSNNGTGQTSAWVQTSPPVSPGTTPGAPTRVHAVPGNASAVISWNAPDQRPETYEVRQSTDNATWTSSTPGSVAATSTSLTVTGLTNGTGYYFQVRSARGGSTSAWVSAEPAPVVPTGSYVVPSAPLSLTAVPGNGLAVMYWQMTAGTVVTGYEVQYSVNNSTWLPSTPIATRSTTQNYTLTGLSNGVPTYLRVRAVNGTASSAWTQMPGTVVPVGTPNAPTAVVAVPGNGQATVSWTPPAGSSGLITGYRVQYSSNNGTTWVPAANLSTPATTTLVAGLTNGTSYIFRVAATGPSGDGPWSNPSAAIIPPGAPGAPTNVIAVAGNTQATVSWTPPTGTLVSPIIGYRVTSAPGGQTCLTAATPPATPAVTCTVTGLTNGVPVTFTVVTLSAAGTSAPSAPSAAVTPVGGPSAPSNVTAVAGDRSATVSWTAPASQAGGPITSYRATSSPDGRSCTVSAPATTCTVTGLTNGQAYTFTVVAISATGTSPSSAASAPVTPFTNQVTIKITNSSRNGSKVVISGTTQGLQPGDTLDVLTRTSAKGQFNPAGEVTVKSNGTFRWTGTSTKKTWIRVTDGDVVSNTVIVPAR